MKKKLNDLPSIMEKGVYNEQIFTEESKRNVRNRIKKRNSNVIPTILTISVACGFFGLGAFYIIQELDLFDQNTLQTSEEIKMPVSIAPIDLNGDLSADLPLMINDELIGSLSLPLEIQEVVPSVSSKPTISARTISEGYSISLTFPGDGFEVNMIENVELPESIEQYKKTRTQIWSDEETILINGNDAFFSVDQKEMHIFTQEKYFILHGVEKEQLLNLAGMIDTKKPVQEIELKEYEEVIMYNIELSDINQKIYLPTDFHKNVEYLKDSKAAFVKAEKNETAFTIRFGYSAPTDSSELMVEQHYSENGNSHIIQQINRDYTLEKEVEMTDRKIFLYSNGFHHAGYFTYQNNLFEVRTMNSVSLEHIQEILSGIKLAD